MSAKELAKAKKEHARLNREGLDRVTAHFGSRAKIGLALGLSRATPVVWKEVPIIYVRQLSTLTGIPPELILPSPYPFTLEK